MMMMGKMREWTNEEHVEFLNSLEASFVRAMFAVDGGVNTEEEQHPSSQNDCLLRLDRFLPDSSDSTEDLPTQRRRSYNKSSPLLSGSNRSTIVKAERKTRRLLRSQPYAHLQGQVVRRAVLRRRE